MRHKVGVRILLDSYVAGNFGDDLLISLLSRRYPEHDFYVMCNEAYLPRFGSMNNIHAVGEISSQKYSVQRRVIDKIRLIFGRPRMGFSRLLERRGFDLYLLFGGSLFIEGHSLTARGRRGEIRTGIRNTRVSGIMNCNFGPYASTSFLKSYMGIFRTMDFLSFRESGSYALFEDIEGASYGADISLDGYAEFESDVRTIHGPSVDSSVMSIFPVSLRRRAALASQEQGYLDAIEGLARRYLADRARSVVISPCCVAEGDLDACRQLSQRLSDCKARVRVEVPQTVPEFISQISRSEVVVGSRFHSVCVALATGVPVYVLSYSRKIDNMLADIGIDENCIDIKDLGDVGFESFKTTVSTTSARKMMSAAKIQFERFESALALLY